MTGVAFLLFTFYMVTDPATTPSTPRGQIAFGAAVAAAYGLLMAFHVVFGLFFAPDAWSAPAAARCSTPRQPGGAAGRRPSERLDARRSRREPELSE